MSAFNKSLVCPLCGGYFRAAHTLLDCGHTYCYICFASYLQSLKGFRPQIKCPTCFNPIDNLNKSIVVDQFKQALVDLLTPDSVAE